METLQANETLFAITREDLQNEAIEKMGRQLTDEEILVAKKSLEWAIGESIGIVYNTIFSEIIKQ